MEADGLLETSELLRRQVNIYRQKARADNEALAERLDNKGAAVSQYAPRAIRGEGSGGWCADASPMPYVALAF